MIDIIQRHNFWKIWGHNLWESETFGAQESNVIIAVQPAIDIYDQNFNRSCCCNEIIINIHLNIIFFLCTGVCKHRLQFISVCLQVI